MSMALGLSSRVGLGARVQCALSIITGDVKFSVPSTSGKKSVRNLIIFSPSAPSLMPTKWTFCLLLLFSRSRHLSCNFLRSLEIACCACPSAVTLSMVSLREFPHFLDIADRLCVCRASSPASSLCIARISVFVVLCREEIFVLISLNKVVISASTLISQVSLDTCSSPLNVCNEIELSVETSCTGCVAFSTIFGLPTVNGLSVFFICFVLSFFVGSFLFFLDDLVYRVTYITLSSCFINFWLFRCLY